MLTNTCWRRAPKYYDVNTQLFTLLVLLSKTTCKPLVLRKSFRTYQEGFRVKKCFHLFRTCEIVTSAVRGFAFRFRSQSKTFLATNRDLLWEDGGKFPGRRGREKVSPMCSGWGLFFGSIPLNYCDTKKLYIYQGFSTENLSRKTLMK